MMERCIQSATKSNRIEVREDLLGRTEEDAEDY